MMTMRRNHRKYLHGSAANERLKHTRHFQKEAAKEGIVHPRRLARSVAKAYCRANGIPESENGTYFRMLIKKLPRKGRKYLLTEAERAARRGGRRILKKA